MIGKRRDHLSRQTSSNSILLLGTGTPTQRIHNTDQIHPELVLGAAVLPISLFLLHLLHGRKLHLSASDSYHRARQRIIGDFVFGLASKGFNVLHTLDTETDGTHTVHG